MIEAVNQQAPRLRTKSLDISFSELANMFESGELVIKPEYQRLFRWSEDKQSRFIESILLEMPIPPVFVIELDDGVYELVDGLQRISSYLHFVGIHPDRKSKLRLSGCDIIRDLNDKTWDDLPTALQFRIRRYFVRVEVVKKESDLSIRYDIFKRLNTGGELLSEQELRNCSIRLLSSRFIDFINELSQIEDYRKCMDSLSPEAKEKRQDEEFVLRFFAFKNHRDAFKHEVGDFMTSYAELVSNPQSVVLFDYEGERLNFERTFQVLNAILGENIFCRYYTVRGKVTASGQLRPNYFEAFSLGVQKALHRIDLSDAETLDKVRTEFIQLRFDPEFQRVTGAGVNYPGPLNRRIGMVEEALERALA